MLEVEADSDVWRINFELLPPQPSRGQEQVLREEDLYKRLALLMFRKNH